MEVARLASDTKRLIEEEELKRVAISQQAEKPPLAFTVGETWNLIESEYEIPHDNTFTVLFLPTIETILNGRQTFALLVERAEQKQIRFCQQTVDIKTESKKTWFQLCSELVNTQTKLKLEKPVQLPKDVVETHHSTTQTAIQLYVQPGRRPIITGTTDHLVVIQFPLVLSEDEYSNFDRPSPDESIEKALKPAAISFVHLPPKMEYGSVQLGVFPSFVTFEITKTNNPILPNVNVWREFWTRRMRLTFDSERLNTNVWSKIKHRHFGGTGMPAGLRVLIDDEKKEEFDAKPKDVDALDEWIDKQLAIVMNAPQDKVTGHALAIAALFLRQLPRNTAMYRFCDAAQILETNRRRYGSLADLLQEICITAQDEKAPLVYDRTGHDQLYYLLAQRDEQFQTNDMKVPLQRLRTRLMLCMKFVYILHEIEKATQDRNTLNSIVAKMIEDFQSIRYVTDYEMAISPEVKPSKTGEWLIHFDSYSQGLVRSVHGDQILEDAIFNAEKYVLRNIDFETKDDERAIDTHLSIHLTTRGAAMVCALLTDVVLNNIERNKTKGQSPLYEVPLEWSAWSTPQFAAWGFLSVSILSPKVVAVSRRLASKLLPWPTKKTGPWIVDYMRDWYRRRRAIEDEKENALVRAEVKRDAAAPAGGDDDDDDAVLQPQLQVIPVLTDRERLELLQQSKQSFFESVACQLHDPNWRTTILDQLVNHKDLLNKPIPTDEETRLQKWTSVVYDVINVSESTLEIKVRADRKELQRQLDLARPDSIPFIGLIERSVRGIPMYEPFVQSFPQANSTFWALRGQILHVKTDRPVGIEWEEEEAFDVLDAIYPLVVPWKAALSTIHSSTLEFKAEYKAPVDTTVRPWYPVFQLPTENKWLYLKFIALRRLNFIQIGPKNYWLPLQKIETAINAQFKHISMFLIGSHETLLVAVDRDNPTTPQKLTTEQLEHYLFELTKLTDRNTPLPLQNNLRRSLASIFLIVKSLLRSLMARYCRWSASVLLQEPRVLQKVASYMPVSTRYVRGLARFGLVASAFTVFFSDLSLVFTARWGNESRATIFRDWFNGEIGSRMVLGLIGTPTDTRPFTLLADQKQTINDTLTARNMTRFQGIVDAPDSLFALLPIRLQEMARAIYFGEILSAGYVATGLSAVSLGILSFFLAICLWNRLAGESVKLVTWNRFAGESVKLVTLRKVAKSLLKLVKRIYEKFDWDLLWLSDLLLVTAFFVVLHDMDLIHIERIVEVGYAATYLGTAKQYLKAAAPGLLLLLLNLMQLYMR